MVWLEECLWDRLLILLLRFICGVYRYSCPFVSFIILCLMIYLLNKSCNNNIMAQVANLGQLCLVFFNHRDLKLTHSEKQNI
jgi:hypothetical protein